MQYLVVGGTAIAFYGFVWPTTTRDGTVLNEDDFDFWFNPTYPNYPRLLDAFDDMQLDISRFREEEHPNVKRSFFQLKPEGLSIYFLPSVGGNLTFRDCHSKRFLAAIGEIEISIISLDVLLICKKSTGRKKDLADITFLEGKQQK